MTKAKIISIVIDKGDAGLLHATSPQMPELFVSGETEGELLEAVPVVLRAIFKAHGKDVQVVEVEDDMPGVPMPWVILSTTGHAAC